MNKYGFETMLPSSSSPTNDVITLDLIDGLPFAVLEIRSQNLKKKTFPHMSQFIGVAEVKKNSHANFFCAELKFN